MVVGRKLLIISATLFLVSVFYVNATGNVVLDCEVTTSCSGTTVFKMNSQANAHAELYDQTNYNYEVCCRDTGLNSYPIGNLCTEGVSSTEVVKLSSQTNAHVQKPSVGTYSYDACMSAPSTVEMECTYTTQNCQDVGYDTCVATISSDTNAHTADCTTNPYPTKVCCRTVCQESTETSCTDGIDNDCDGKVDCEDEDCAGGVSGTVEDDEGDSIEGAQVDSHRESEVKNTAYTDVNGDYSMGTVFCGTYDFTASADGYLTSSITDVDVPPLSSVVVDFTGADALTSGSTCESDCTYAGDNTIHQECSGVNDCAFYDSTAEEVCDLAQPGWVRDYNSTHEVECAEGIPTRIVGVKADVACEEENVIKQTKVVKYKGKLVNLVVVACG